MKRTNRNEILKFQRDTQGMTHVSEEKKDIQKDTPVKIIKPGQVCVCVLNMRGKPLMPTSPRKARLLLKKGKAKVVQRNPFTVQLKYPTGENRQPIVLENVPFQTEHIIPTSIGGTNRISNLTIACQQCNQEKGQHD